MFQRLKTGTKSGFDKGWRALDKRGAPVDKSSNKLGSEAFWPTTLEKESDKAARILKSFCRDGFYVDEEQPGDGPKQTQRLVKNIPEEVIRNAAGLAIFTTMRTGLWISGAGGSGVLVARKADGTWSPPSGIMLHTAGLGFLAGIDIYDCVLVLNTDQAVEAFSKARCTLGEEVSVVAGPVGVVGVLETEVHKRQPPVFTYMKSRGFYAGVQIDGTIVIERMDENQRFYGEELPVRDILAGKVRHPPYEIGRLIETIKAAQGDTNYDEAMIPGEPPPGDYEIDDGNMFGIPDKEDPDPYGVLALEKEGMSLREAGTKQRASWEQFSFNPAPTSPIHSIYSRASHDGGSRTVSNRNSWRNTLNSDSKMSSSLRNSVEVRSIASNRSARSQMADSSTQTDLAEDLPSPQDRRSSYRSSQHSSKGSTSNLPQMIPENGVLNSKQEPAPFEDVDPIALDDDAYTTSAKRSSNERYGLPSESPLLSEEGPSSSNKEQVAPTVEERVTKDEQNTSAVNTEKPAERVETISANTQNGYSTPPATPPAVSNIHEDLGAPLELSDDDYDDEYSGDEYDDDDLQIIEEPVVHSVQTMQLKQPSLHAFPAARVVTVPKRLPPALPARNPNRRNPAGVKIVSSDLERPETIVSPAGHAAVEEQSSVPLEPSAPIPELDSGSAHESKESAHYADREQLKCNSPTSPTGQNMEGHEAAPSHANRKETQQSAETDPKIPGGFD